MEKPDELRTNADVQQIKAEISDTQAEIQHTVAEIQERLSPAHLKDQAVSTVQDATIGKVQQMMNGTNPIPYALIGIGAVWLLANRRSSDRPWSGYGQGSQAWGGRPAYGSGEYGANEMRSGSATRDLSSTTGEWQAAASERAEAVTEGARRMASQARNRWETMLDDNPMALGIAALAAGALIGASLPQTEVENAYLGETRDQLIDSAREVAHDAVEKVEKATGSDQSV